jgi:hypothetical protein
MDICQASLTVTVHFTNHSVEQSGIEKNENRSIVDTQRRTQHLQRGWELMDRGKKEKKTEKEEEIDTYVDDQIRLGS